MVFAANRSDMLPELFAELKKTFVKSNLPIFSLFFWHEKIDFSDRIEDMFWTKTLDYTGFVSESRWNMKPLHQFIQRNRLNMVYQT